MKNNLRVIGCVLALVLSAGSLSVQALTDKEIEAMFNEGLEQLESGDLARAINIFEDILSDQPDLNRVRMELALANFRSLNYAEARRQAEQVLDDPSTPENVKSSVRRFLKEVEKQDKRHVWTPYISLGIMHDDNVNVSSISSGVIDVGGTPFIIIVGGGPISDEALQINAGVSHRYLSPNTMQFAGREVAFAWQSNLSLFRNQYFSEDDFHLNVVTARTGPTWLAARHWRLQIPVQGDDVRIGGDRIAQYAGVFPSLTYFFDRRISLTANLQLQGRDFHRRIDDDRDSFYTAGGLSLGYRSLTGRFSALISGQLYNEDADTDRRSNDGTQWAGALNFRPWPNTNTYARISRRSRDFDDVEPIFGIARDETEKRYSLGANYTIGGSGSAYLDDLVLGFAYSHTDNDSNVPLFDYDRDQFLFNISRSF